MTEPARKATAVAPSNIAFIKYWGARDLERALPHNPSISMTLSRCFSRCTVEHRPDGDEHRVLLRSSTGELRPPGAEFTQRVVRHLDRIRKMTDCPGGFHVATENSFPAAAGLASSASGFASLSLAATRALGLELDSRELSSLSRLSGSGSAARSALGGYVEWPAVLDDPECCAVALATAEDWDLRDVIAVVDSGPKKTSSLEGHRRAPTSPHYEKRQEQLPARLQAVREAIAQRDLEALGPVLEDEAIDLHLVAMSSKPAIFYWRPATLEVLWQVRSLRDEGVAAWATMDAGPNVHVICPPEAEEPVARRLGALAGVQSVIRDAVGTGPGVVSEHLF